jgi:hypothetical protein
MRVHLLVRNAVLVTSLAVIPWMFAPSLFADDQPAGQGPAPQQEITKGATDTQPSVQQEMPATTQLGAGTERPMKVPEGQESDTLRSLESQQPEYDLHEIIRRQDEISSLSF